MKVPTRKDPAQVFADTGAFGDYGGNHGDASSGSVGTATDFYFGGNGTGIIISSRPICSEGQPVGWRDRIRPRHVVDGTSRTILAGEAHVSRNRLGAQPDDGPIFSGQRFNFSTRIAGPGARLGRGPNDQTTGNQSFGSWHPGICQFVFADGSVRSVENSVSSQVLETLANRHDSRRSDEL